MRSAIKRPLPLNPVPAIPAAIPSGIPYVDQLNIGAGRRALAIGLAVLIPALLLLLLLSFGSGKPPDFRTERVSTLRLEARDVAADSPEKVEAEPDRSETRPERPQAAIDPAPPAEPAEPRVAEPAPPPPTPAPVERPSPPVPPRPAVRPPGGAVYGPPDTGTPRSSFRDSEQVGTAPNGEPLYAATWYREPSDGELRGYLSTASGPGWGLIACRTAPDYRVEDCVGLDEYPTGSQINRAVLAAAWQFRVRPPRRGGQQLVGAWVRIRIDYGVRRR